MSTVIPSRPALWWHGGKWRLAPWIVGHFSPHRIYVEPYGGAAGVLLRKPRSYSEVYNDLDGGVVALYRILRDPDTRAQLADAVAFTPFSREEFNASYDEAETDMERARRLLVRSHMGFGSAGASGYRTGFRGSVKRSGSTPSHTWATLPPVLSDVGRRFEGVVIEQAPALEVIERYDSPETLYYVDPPYREETRNSSGDCYAFEMTDADHIELAHVLHQVQGAVVLSGYDCDLYADLYDGWTSVRKNTQGSGQSGSVQRTEVLWLRESSTPNNPMGL